MRLIDADALNEEFKEVYPLATNEMGGVVNKRIYEIIDNAPTVLHDNYSLGYQDGVKKVLSERPKGEWIEDSGNIACSHCHTIWLYRRTDFCPNCGADMRGKGGRE